MEKDKVEEDHSATAEVKQEEMNEEVQQPKPMDLVRELLGENDSVARIRCLIKIFELLIKLAKVKSEKLLQYIRVKSYTREIIRLCSKSIAAVVATVKNHLENIQFANVLPIRYSGTLPKNSSLGNVHELVRDPTEKSTFKQWKMAPVNLSKGKSALKCRKVPEVRGSSRSHSRLQAFPNNNFDRFLQLDDDNMEDDLDDDSDELSLPSSTTGISTLNSDDKNRISTLEAQLAQLQAQLQFLINAQSNQAGGDACGSMHNSLPSLVSSSTSSEPPTKRVPPPPAPPLPPPDFLKPKRPLQSHEVKSEPGAQVFKIESEKPEKAPEVRGRPLLLDALKGFDKVQLRKVDRSPNGTPMRGAIESWPTFHKRRYDNLEADKENVKNRAPSSILEKNAANSGEFIALALQRKFANVRLSENFNETDNEEDNNSSSGWDDDVGNYGIQCQNKY